MNRNLIEALMFLSGEDFEYFVNNLSDEERTILRGERAKFEVLDKEIEARFTKTIGFYDHGNFVAYFEYDNMYRSFLGANIVHLPKLKTLLDNEKNAEYPYLALKKKYEQILKTAQWAYNRLKDRI